MLPLHYAADRGSMQHSSEPDQRDLYELLPEVSGGRALAAQRGPGYLAEIGATGGASTLSRYGRVYLAALGERGRQERRRRRDDLPRTIQRLDGSTARVIPWHPHRGSSEYSPRRRRPVFVLVELGAGDE